MAEAPGDPYAAARENLRETAKWLATVLSGLGALVAAGISVSGFAALNGEPLRNAIAAGGLAMACILFGIALLVRILGVEAYFLSQLRATPSLVKAIDNAGSDLLPPGIGTFDKLATNRDTAYRAVANCANLPADNPTRKAAEATYASYRAETSRILSFASFLRLRSIFNWTLFALLGLFIVASGSLAWLGYQLAKAEPGAPSSQNAAFDPGANWSGLTAALAQECGAGPFTAITIGDAPFEGWWKVKLVGPGPCADAEVTVPETLVTIAASR